MKKNKELPINTVVCGDALTVLKTFPSKSIDMVVTSPPYWGLRDYGMEQIFGGDKTLSCCHCNDIIIIRGNSSEVYSLRQGKANQKQESKQKNLQQGLLNQVGHDRGETKENQGEKNGRKESKLEGGNKKNTWLHNGASSKSPKFSSGLCNGASVSNGKNDREIFKERGISSSYQCNKKRQSARKSSISNSESPQGRSDLSFLSKEVRDKLKCLSCGSKDFKFIPCEHEWGQNVVKKAPHGGKGIVTEMLCHDTKSNYCQKCQAWKGQLGLEPTPEMYIEHLTEIFNEVKRVLKRKGTLWLVIGDTYSGSGGAGGDYNKGGLREGQSRFKQGETRLPAKCLTMIPERLAWSLIQNGWILRNKIVWYKPNAMPSSVTDRFSNRWEYLFMFSKSQRYYFDLDSVREEHTGIDSSNMNFRPNKLMQFKEGRRKEYKGKTSFKQNTGHSYNFLGKNPGDVFEIGAETRTMGAIIGSGGGVKVPGGKGWTGHPRGGGAACQKDPRWCPPGGKNPGDFWDINTQPFPEAHFAVFPEKLCEKPIKAGCPEEVCKKCGKARERIIETISLPTRPARKGKDLNHKIYSGSPEKFMPFRTGNISEVACSCNAGFEGGIVLDPFAGAGTALYVAKEMKRRYIGIDIKQEYCDMCEKRLAQGVL